MRDTIMREYTKLGLNYNVADIQGCDMGVQTQIERDEEVVMRR